MFYVGWLRLYLQHSQQNVDFEYDGDTVMPSSYRPDETQSPFQIDECIRQPEVSTSSRPSILQSIPVNSEVEKS